MRPPDGFVLPATPALVWTNQEIGLDCAHVARLGIPQDERSAMPASKGKPRTRAATAVHRLRGSPLAASTMAVAMTLATRVAGWDRRREAGRRGLARGRGDRHRGRRAGLVIGAPRAACTAARTARMRLMFPRDSVPASRAAARSAFSPPIIESAFW